MNANAGSLNRRKFSVFGAFIALLLFLAMMTGGAIGFVAARFSQSSWTEDRHQDPWLGPERDEALLCSVTS